MVSPDTNLSIPAEIPMTSPVSDYRPVSPHGTVPSRSRALYSRPLLPIHGLIVLLSATLLAGCVDLKKPEEIKDCTAAGNCVDDPYQQPPKRDASGDAEEPGPDAPDAESPDAVPDTAVRDVPTDPGSQVGDSIDSWGKDGGDGGVEPGIDGSLPSDAGPDVGLDVVRKDVGVDVAPDVGVDLSPDLGPDLGPDLKPDVAPDLPPDLPRDTTPDTGLTIAGLLAYYKCDNATGTTLPDSSGNANNGTLTAAATSGYVFQAGKVGRALALASAGQGYVSLPPALFRNATAITIAAWVNVTTSQSWARLFDVGRNAQLENNTPTGTLYMNLVPKNDGTNLAFSITKDGYDNEEKLVGPALATSTWKHVAVVLGTGSGALYIDGALVTGAGTTSLRPSDLGAIDYAYLGKSQFGADPYFDGMLDEVRVYSRALSATEVRTVYQFSGP